MFNKNATVINCDNRKVGKIPVGVARELVGTGAAMVVRQKPAVVKLEYYNKPANRQRPNKPVTQPKINALKNIVDMAGRFAGKPRLAHIMSNMLIRIEGGALYVSATDLEACFTGRVDAGDKYRFSHDAGGINAVCVPPDGFKRYLEHAETDGVVDIGVRKRGDVVGLQIGEFFLEGDDAERFPVIPEADKGTIFTVTDVRDKLEFVRPALAPAGCAGVIRGILFDFSGNRLVGADGNRMHLTPLREGGCVAQKDTANNGIEDWIGCHAVVPQKILTIARHLTGKVMLVNEKDAGGDVIQHAVFELNVSGCIQCHARFRSIDGQYPNIADIIPRNNNNVFKTSTNDMAPALKKALVWFGEKDLGVVSVAFDATGVRINTEAWAKTPHSAVITGGYTGTPYKASIDPAILYDCVQAMPPGGIEICVSNDPDAGWVIKGGMGFAGVVMPMEKNG